MKESGQPLSVNEVTIQGFRSLREVSKLKLTRLSVLAGLNGTGKSNVLRFFELLSEFQSRKTQHCLRQRTFENDKIFNRINDTVCLIQSIIFIKSAEGHYDYRFTLKQDHSNAPQLLEEAYRHVDTLQSQTAEWKMPPVLASGSLPQECSDSAVRTIRHLFRHCFLYWFPGALDSATIYQRCDIQDCMRLRPNGSNLAAILYDLHENDYARYRLIGDQIRRVVPAFEEFVFEPAGDTVGLCWKSRGIDKVFTSTHTSNSTLRLFCLVTLLNLPDDRLPALLLLDEPDSGLHPHAVRLIGSMIRRVSEKHQVILTTQSPCLVDCFDLESLLIADYRNGETILKNIDKAKYREWLDNGYRPSDIWLAISGGDM